MRSGVLALPSDRVSAGALSKQSSHSAELGGRGPLSSEHRQAAWAERSRFLGSCLQIGNADCKSIIVEGADDSET
jgi:hypothetical protein